MNAEVIIDKLLSLNEQFESTTLAILNLEEIKEKSEEEIDKIEFATTREVLTAKDIDGKDKYSNTDKRDIAKKEILLANSKYRELKQEVWRFVQDINRMKKNLEIISFKQSSLKRILEYRSSQLRGKND